MDFLEFMPFDRVFGSSLPVLSVLGFSISIESAFYSSNTNDN